MAVSTENIVEKLQIAATNGIDMFSHDNHTIAVNLERFCDDFEFCTPEELIPGIKAWKLRYLN